MTINQYATLRKRYAGMLQYLRSKKGTTQQKVAECLGVTRKAVWNGENAKVIPSAYSAFQLSLFYHIPYELMCLVPPKAHNKIDVNNPATYAFITLDIDKLEKYIDDCATERKGQINVWL